jgi:hypothetical protein
MSTETAEPTRCEAALPVPDRRRTDMLISLRRGHVDMDALSTRALKTYLYARALRRRLPDALRSKGEWPGGLHDSGAVVIGRRRRNAKQQG